ncbi:hypothetical protein E5D57_011294 [Metarhizium anisopliae]|nr:hypothetical protein E5D57_011294 [Metarhizium anisopliae]
MDYYSSSFAIQFLQLLYAQLAGDEDPDRAAEFRQRAQLAALDLVHYYDDQGRAIPFGRSVGYRFAMVSFWGALAYAHVELPAPLTWGMVKGIVLRNLRWWQTQTEMWTSSGTLSLGYSYPNMYLTENYNSPASPYWACLAFICLAVPESHPFWTSEEELVSHTIPSVKELPHPGHIMRRVSEYAGIEYRDGQPVLVSRWKPFSDVRITTTLVPSAPKTPNWHLRVHCIQTGRQLMTADGSFAICNVNSVNGRYLESYGQEQCEGTMPKIIGNYDTNSPAGWATGKDGSFAVHATKGAVGIKALEPMGSRRAMLVNADPNSNLVDSRTTIPTLQGSIETGQAAWYVSAIYAKPGQDGVSKMTYLDGWQTPPNIPRWLSVEMNKDKV